MWFLYYKVDRNITKFYHILLLIGLYLKFMSMKIKSKSIGWFASEGLYANFLYFIFFIHAYKFGRRFEKKL